VPELISAQKKTSQVNTIKVFTQSVLASTQAGLPILQALGIASLKRQQAVIACKLARLAARLGPL
jgi:type II secretory pathway component PulF